MAKQLLIIGVALAALALAAPAEAHHHRHHHRHHGHDGGMDNKRSGAIHMDGPDTSAPHH